LYCIALYLFYGTILYFYLCKLWACVLPCRN